MKDHLVKIKKSRKRYMLAMWSGYSYGAFILLFLKYNKLIQIDLSTIIIIYLSTTIPILINFLLFYKNLNPGKLHLIFFRTSFLTIFYITFILTLYYLNNMRVVLLILTLGPIFLQASYLTFLASLLYSLGVGVAYFSVAYVSIVYLNQRGEIINEAIYICCYVPVILYISFLSSKFYKQRKDIINVKKQIEKIRDLIWGELKLTKKIQTTLLPQIPEIDNFEISIQSSQIEEICGDFYDTVNYKDQSWIIFGNIFGQGMSTGLLIMMIKTTIYTLLDMNPEISPSQLQSFINKIFIDELKKWDDDKYISILTLKLDHSENIHYSGLHHDMLIYRSESSQVEIIESEGVLIGVLDDIDKIIKNESIILKKNDIILLYSYGITRAIKTVPNKDNTTKKEFFGLKKLKEHLLASNKLSAQGIADNTIKDIKSYMHNDDITLLILKKVK